MSDIINMTITTPPAVNQSITGFGIKGDTGATGAQGPKGDAGDPATNLVASVAGKTGAVTLDKTDVGLSNVDNLAPADMPVSTAQQSALNAKANASDTVNLTGNQTVAGVKTFSSSPIVPTATTSTQAINKAQMDTADALKVNKAGDTMTGAISNTFAGLPYRHQRPSAGDWSMGSSSGSNYVVWNNTTNNAPFEVSSTAGAGSLIVTAAGLRIGASAYYLYGTGFPEGVVTAPVGSIYIDTAITNGASSWIKKSGTGNTGWQVLEGDTGWRDITASFSAYLEKVNVNDYGVYIRRVNNMATISIKAQSKLASFGGETTAIPVGFQGTGGIPVYVAEYLGIANPGRLQTQVSSTFGFVSSTNIGVGTRIYGSTSFPVAVAHSWPTTLPGTAA